MAGDMDEETFLHTINYSPWTYFSDSSEKDENSFQNGGILKQHSDGRNSVSNYHSKNANKNLAAVDPT